MEFIVQIFRALANYSRIRLLRLLCVLGELNASRIAKAASLRPADLSNHLGRLAAVGLVWRRRSGRFVLYRLGERSRHRVVAAALRALHNVFRGLRVRDPRRVADADQARSPVSSDQALFACFTAFTHPRRLQILRYLVRQGSAQLLELAGQLSMSARACSRHLDKLERRGFVRRVRAGRQSTYSLVEGAGSLQRDLFGALCDHLRGETKP